MARLIANVHAAGTWWGPSYGNADRVPADVAAGITTAVWAVEDDGPEASTAAGEDPAQNDAGAAGPGDDDSGNAAPDLSPAPNLADAIEATQLADMDRPELLALAEQRGVTVDRRWGDTRLRAVLAEPDPEG